MTRRTLRWRFAAFASGLVVATMVLVGAASVTPVNAGGSGQLIDMGGWWKDPWCGTSSEQFVIRVWKNTNFSGESWKFCTDYPDFCNAPDKASSFRVSAVRGGVTCEVQVYENKNYGGASWFAFNPGEQADLRPWPNDAFSSIRRTC